MKHLTGFLFILVLCSCGAIQYDLLLNADGSGRQTVFIDAGEMISAMQESIEGMGEDFLFNDSSFTEDYSEYNFDAEDSSYVDYFYDSTNNVYFYSGESEHM